MISDIGSRYVGWAIFFVLTVSFQVIGYLDGDPCRSEFTDGVDDNDLSKSTLCARCKESFGAREMDSE